MVLPTPHQLVPPLLEAGIIRGENPPCLRITALAALGLYLENVAVCDRTKETLRPYTERLLSGVVGALQEGLERGLQSMCEAAMTAIGHIAMKVRFQ